MDLVEVRRALWQHLRKIGGYRKLMNGVGTLMLRSPKRTEGGESTNANSKH